jgi:excisionase family DNA binding protein
MVDLLTSRQVQDILKVDRITVYRMLQDGRLKGVKIGQQWRFPQAEVERLLGAAPSPASAASAGDAAFPTHCIQTVQDLFSDVSQISSLVIDSQGETVTEPSRMCDFCRLVQSTPPGLAACRASWVDFTRRAGGHMYFTCHAGLQYIAAPVMDQAEQLGYFLAGQFYWQQPDPREQAARLGQVTQDCALPAAQLQAAAAAIQVIPAGDHTRVEAWPFTAARAVQSILAERMAMVARLQQIATLTQM